MLYSKHIIKTLSNTIFLGMFFCLVTNVIKTNESQYKEIERTSVEIGIEPGPDEEIDIV